MHNRIWRLGFAAIPIAFIIAATAATSYDVPPWVNYDMGFIHHRQAPGGYIANYDTALAITPASFANLSLTDTSEAVDLRSTHYRGPHTFWHATFGSIVDTVYAFSFTVTTGTYAAVTGADSVEATIQVSPDNQVWTSIDTIGVSNKVRLDMSAAGSAVTSLWSTSHGIGTKRINWDRPAANFLRILLRKDPNAASGTSYKLSFGTRSYGPVQ